MTTSRMEINHQYTRVDFTLIVISNYVLIINILSNNFLLMYKITTLELLEFHCYSHHLNPEKPTLLSPTQIFTYTMKNDSPMQIGTVYKKKGIAK